MSILVIFFSCKAHNIFYRSTYTLDTFDIKSKRLELSYQNLSTVPEGFQVLKVVRVLDHSRNTDIGLKEVLQSLPNPETLELFI